MATAGKASVPGRVVIYPNREKASSQLMKFFVVALFAASAVVMLLLTLSGWSKLQGLKPVDIGWILVYGILAFYVGAKWSRGALTLGAALGIMLLILAVIAGLGLAGTSWFARDSSGFAPPESVFGGELLGAGLLGALTILLIPLQALLIAFTMLAFSQGWNIEAETSAEEARERGYKVPESATA
jgi:hypothetical protein